MNLPVRLLALLLLAPLTAAARDLHVDAAHSEAEHGTSLRPFRAISTAAAHAQPGDTVIIHPGLYRETVALEHGGTAEAPITFAAEKPGTVIISGADLLTDWSPEPEPGVYSTPWPHDFVIDTLPDGTLVRHHFGDPPLGTSELVLWRSAPLPLVMSRAALAEGTFHVDWAADRLYVRLPGHLDPRDPATGPVEGAVRPYLFTPREQWNIFADVRHIVLRHLTLRHAANFPQRGGLVTGSDWQILDCLVDGNSSGGLNLRGDRVTLQRVISRRNGFAGISGVDMTDVLIENCQSYENNQRGFNPGNDGGGGKFLKTRNLRVIGLKSHHNTGPGLWLDYENRDYLIEKCEIYANRGNTMNWEGGGIDSEINPGPGIIRNNLIYSNTGPGIGLWETENVLVEHNILKDNGTNLEFRGMTGREYVIRNITVRHNKSSWWRERGVASGIGPWADDSATTRKLVLENNLYDPPPGKPFYVWNDRVLPPTLQAAQDQLQVEAGSTLGHVTHEEVSKLHSRLRGKLVTLDIESALADAEPGSTVIIPVNGLDSIEKVGEGHRARVYDRKGRRLTLHIAPDVEHAPIANLQTYPLPTPHLFSVVLISADEASLLDG
jgi:hypothetical protein